MFGLKKTYRYRLERDYECKCDAPDCDYPYCSVKDGILTVKRGYAWNGCSPNYSFLGLFFVGTPDGHIDFNTRKPFAYYASLVHDARCQYHIGSRYDTDRQFLRKLIGIGFPLAKLYYIAVRIFGKEWENEG